MKHKSGKENPQKKISNIHIELTPEKHPEIYNRYVEDRRHADTILFSWLTMIFALNGTLLGLFISFYEKLLTDKILVFPLLCIGLISGFILVFAMRKNMRVFRMSAMRQKEMQYGKQRISSKLTETEIEDSMNIENSIKTKGEMPTLKIKDTRSWMIIFGMIIISMWASLGSVILLFDKKEIANNTLFALAILIFLSLFDWIFAAYSLFYETTDVKDYL